MRRYGGLPAFRRNHTEFGGTILFVLILTIAAGCARVDDTSAPPVEASPETDSLNVDLSPIDQAFAVLRTGRHDVVQSLIIERNSVAYTSTMHLHADGRSDGYELISSQEDGVRPSSALSHLRGGDDQGGPRLDELPSLLVEEDPSYLSEYDAFDRSVGPDTVISGIRASITELRRRDDSNRGRPFERVRLYTDDSGDILRLEVETYENTFFFEHRTQRVVELRQTDAGRLPRLVQIGSRSKSFLASPVLSSIRWEFHPADTNSNATGAAEAREAADRL